MAANDQRIDGFSGAATNPLFNERKLRLGTFCSNLSGGTAVSTIDGTLEARWPETLEVAKLADAMEFEAQVPVARWKGFGGPTNFNSRGFETFTWAAAIGASTESSCIFSTSHVPTVHPVMAAKQATTIDHVTGGRFALNVVTGWYKPEIEMFGAPQLEHDERYEMTTEWVKIIKLLWTQDGEVDFDGRYYQVNNAWMAPKPIQKPYPVLMNAAGSDRGRAFAAEHCDVVFVLPQSHDYEVIKEKIESYRRFARDEFDRELSVWMNAYVVQEDTEAEAKRFYEYFVDEMGDWEAVENLTTSLGINSKVMPAKAIQSLKRHFIAGYGGYPLIGGAEQVVDGLSTLVEAGIDGVLLSWPRYIDGMKRFQTETIPLLEQAGLR